jgi:dihydrofolate reductase
MSVKMIWAQSSNGFIGRNGQLLFQIPEDMKRFKEMTKGQIVIMGRKTWESIPEKFRPLPDRVNIILTSTPEKFSNIHPKVAACESMSMAINFSKIYVQQKRMEGEPMPDIWIIGGESLYKEGLQYAEEIYVTNVRQSFMGDAKAPEIPESIFARASVSSLNNYQDLQYQYVTYRRKP